MVLRSAVLVAVLLAVSSVGSAAAQEADVSGPGNQAFVNPAATQDMAGQAKTGLEAILSYTWSDVDSWREAVQAHTVGDANRQLQGQLDTTLPTITRQRVTAATTVVALGVTDQREDHGELLAFLNTSTTRPGKAPVLTAGSVVVSVQRGGQGWQISDLQVRQ